MIQRDILILYIIFLITTIISIVFVVKFRYICMCVYIYARVYNAIAYLSSAICVYHFSCYSYIVEYVYLF